MKLSLTQCARLADGNGTGTRRSDRALFPDENDGCAAADVVGEDETEGGAEPAAEEEAAQGVSTREAVLAVLEGREDGMKVNEMVEEIKARNLWNENRSSNPYNLGKCSRAIGTDLHC